MAKDLRQEEIERKKKDAQDCPKLSAGKADFNRVKSKAANDQFGTKAWNEVRLRKLCIGFATYIFEFIEITGCCISGNTFLP